jgi:hypothetical protein
VKHQMLPERVHCNYLINIGKMIMKKRNQITQAAVLAVAAVSSLNAIAETATVQATVTIDNSIDFTATGTMNFGTLRATAANTATDCAGVTLPANPATTTLSTTLGAVADAACNSVNATVQAIGGTLARPTFTIAGVPAFSNLDITVPTTVELTAPLAPGAASFTLSDFTAWKITGGGTVNTAIPITVNAGVIQANGTGGASFSVGATIRTDDSFAGQNYENNVAYVGDIEVEVSYQ